MDKIRTADFGNEVCENYASGEWSGKGSTSQTPSRTAPSACACVLGKGAWQSSVALSGNLFSKVMHAQD